MRFCCPACGFTVFNRRLKHCESCKAELPAALQFNAADLLRLEEESRRLEQARQELAREAEVEEARKRRRRGDGG
jgi:hypothetical protein